MIFDFFSYTLCENQGGRRGQRIVNYTGIQSFIALLWICISNLHEIRLQFLKFMIYIIYITCRPGSTPSYDLIQSMECYSWLVSIYKARI